MTPPVQPQPVESPAKAMTPMSVDAAAKAMRASGLVTKIRQTMLSDGPDGLPPAKPKRQPAPAQAPQQDDEEPLTMSAELDGDEGNEEGVTEDDGPESPPARREAAPVDADDEDEESEEEPEPKAIAQKRVAMDKEFTQKSQRFAERQRALETEFEAQFKTLAEQLARQSVFLEAHAPKKPDFKRILSEQGSDAYALAREEYEEAMEAHQQQVGSIDEAVKALHGEREKAQRAKIARFGERLLEAIPAWKDTAVLERDRGELEKFAKARYGYTDADLSEFLDHRHVLMLRDALAYSKLKRPAPTAQRAARDTPQAPPEPTLAAVAQPLPTRVMRPGATPPKRESPVKASLSRHATEQSLQSGAEAIKQIMRREAKNQQRREDRRAG